ncbi:hypothetical protein B0H14DRAFT_3430462 [Mycena olivaceomarginata]|nr:hypothetical protein B0H14DRAFT_3430462 [Mycena olivaceomarginata]
MFNTQALFTAALIAATMLTTAWGKAQAILYATGDCTGAHSGTIGMSTGVCHSTDFVISPPGGAPSEGYAHSIHFYTDGAIEDYEYYSDTNCNHAVQSSRGASGCVSLASNVKSFKKKD